MTQTTVFPIKYKWIGRQADLDAAHTLADTFHLHPLVARILTTRNCARVESAGAFLQANRSSLIDPMMMHDMPKAVARIRQAIEAQEPILVYGDYDVDGTAATAILVRTLRKLGADPAWFVPSRFTDGYGLHTNVVQAAAEQGVKLLITVDTGITAVEAGEAAKALGVDLIVTDHHHISTVPNAVALVHPAYPRSMYSFPDLCGAGVAFKLAQALLGEFPEDLLDLVALATVADQVPLVGENRVLVKEGLKRLNREPNLGLEALIAVAGLAEKRVTSTAAAFQLAPRINAVGRLAHAKRAVELFLTEDPQEALSIARELNVYNDRRKALQSQVETEALAQIEAHPNWLEKKGLVVAGKGWHEGVIGIVAGKLTERFWKSTLCVTVDGDRAKGSGRAIPEYDLYRALADVQQRTGVFEKFGGHEAAAGFSLATADLNRLQKSYWYAVERNWFEDVELDPHRITDAPLDLGELSFSLVDDLAKLEPFGNGNPEPVFFVAGVTVEAAQTMGKENQHLKVWVRNEQGFTYPVLAFGKGEQRHAWQTGTLHHLLVTVGDHQWKGERTIQLRMVDGR